MDPIIRAKAIRALLPVLILAAGGFLYSKLSKLPVEEEKKQEQKQNQIKTKVKVLNVVDFQTTVRTRGIVRAHDQVTLTPRVGGTISLVSEGFDTGTFFKKGDTLLELDPADFQTAVLSAEAQVARTKAALAFEETRAKQAKLNWEDLGFDEDPNELVLRLPQLREAQANVDSALAQLEQARRNLERAKVRAPFDGRVLERLVGLGQSVSPGTRLGTIYAIDYAEVDLPLSGKDLGFVRLPETAGDPALEVVLQDAVNPGESSWKARIVRTQGTLDPSSLELFAIARIEDPFGRESGLPPLRIGQPVLATIHGKVLEKVVEIPRSAIRELDLVRLVDPKELTLSNLNIKPLWADETKVVVSDPSIADGTFLATTPMPWAPVGAKVVIKEDASSSEEHETGGDGPRRRRFHP
jgi:RND family efflux transporter MFP subunit